MTPKRTGLSPAGRVLTIPNPFRSRFIMYGAHPHVGRAQPRGIRGAVVGLLLGLALRGHARAIVLDFAAERRRVPVENAGHEPRRWLGRRQAAVPRLDGDAGASRQNVVQVEGALV